MIRTKLRILPYRLNELMIIVPVQAQGQSLLSLLKVASPLCFMRDFRIDECK
jgi:hypothetical protein